MDPGRWIPGSEIVDLGRFAAPRHPDTSQGGGAFPPLRNAKGFRSRFLEEGGSLRSNLERLSGRDPERN